MKHEDSHRQLAVLLLGTCLLGLTGCAQGFAGGAGTGATTSIPGSAFWLGGGASVGHLTVYPILGERGSADREIVSFDRALALGDVDLREIDGGGNVGSVTVENRGSSAILILAGTIIKGGKQDRQIGQDFVIGPGKKVEVDAYCVEHGRWDDRREGRATGGAFEAGKTLAPRQVREAAHYKSNQSEVWDNVATENGKRGKSAPSGTLMATLDAGDVKASAEAMSRELGKRLQALPDWSRVVGLAYAVDGQIKGGRWFVHHELYRENQDTLLHTMAIEAVGMTGAAPPAPAPVSVAFFLGELRAAKAKEVKTTKSLNSNRYRETAKGYSAETLVPMGGRDVEVSAAYLAK